MVRTRCDFFVRHGVFVVHCPVAAGAGEVVLRLRGQASTLVVAGPPKVPASFGRRCEEHPRAGYGDRWNFRGRYAAAGLRGALQTRVSRANVCRAGCTCAGQCGQFLASPWRSGRLCAAHRFFGKGGQHHERRFSVHPFGCRTKNTQQRLSRLAGSSKAATPTGL